MNMNKTKVDGGTIYHDVPAWGSAMNILREEGVEVARAAESPVESRAFYRDSVSVHIYFENSDGDEVAYYTPCMENLFVFDVPRKVHESMRAGKTMWNRGALVSP